jgi:hypothetical protein
MSIYDILEVLSIASPTSANEALAITRLCYNQTDTHTTGNGPCHYFVLPDGELRIFDQTDGCWISVHDPAKPQDWITYHISDGDLLLHMKHISSFSRSSQRP